jgi:hypothetical protein
VGKVEQVAFAFCFALLTTFVVLLNRLDCRFCRNQNQISTSDSNHHHNEMDTTTMRSLLQKRRSTAFQVQFDRVQNDEQLPGSFDASRSTSGSLSDWLFNLSFASSSMLPAVAQPSNTSGQPPSGHQIGFQNFDAKAFPAPDDAVRLPSFPPPPYRVEGTFHLTTVKPSERNPLQVSMNQYTTSLSLSLSCCSALKAFISG